MKNIFTVLAAILALNTAIDCYGADPEQLNRTVEINTTITAVTAADLDIKDVRVSKTDSWRIKIFSPTDLEQRKANLIVELCREVGADVLVDPQFTFTKRPLGGGKLTVSGYPATYKNFRSMTDNEVDAFITTPEYQQGKVVFINK
ncbi:MAG: hypothetical protein NC328_06290 [Muribaculum sp.]|nr:hypothetical protein [Muribaculum sp.]